MERELQCTLLSLLSFETREFCLIGYLNLRVSEQGRGP